LTRITIRGDGHYGRPEVMAWCEENAIDFIFGLPGNAVLDRAVDEIADDIRTRRALDQKPCLRGFADTRYRAKSWDKERRACARIEAHHQRPRYPLRRHQPPGRICPSISTRPSTAPAARPKTPAFAGAGSDQAAQGPARLRPHLLPQPARQSDAPYPRAKASSPAHTAAYWLILTVRDAIPATHALAAAEFATIRLRLLKLGTRVIETACRVRLAFAAACPDATLFRQIATALMPAGP